MTGKRNVHLPVKLRPHTSSQQHIPQPWSPPPTIHHRPIEPIYASNLFQLRAHGMPSVPCALQRTHDLVLREVILQLVDRELHGLDTISVDRQRVRIRLDHGDPAVISVVRVAVGGRDEAIKPSASALSVTSRSQYRLS